jgi:hypothetical protein
LTADRGTGKKTAGLNQLKPLIKKAPGNRGQKLRRADEGNRTPNLLITNQLLYQLSYVSGMFES